MFWARSSLSRFLFLSLLLFGCVRPASVLAPSTVLAEQLPASIFATTPPDKGLRELANFFVIDDFNIREMKNRLGAKWEIESTQAGSFRFRHISQNALANKRGSSLRLKAALQPSQQIILKSSLKGLDMSQARALVLKCRLQSKTSQTFSGKLELTLKDFNEETQTNDFTSNCLSGHSDANGWRETIFPRALFGTLDWERLEEVAITFSAGAEAFKGEIGIDEIAFYGTADVEFQSQWDNLLGFPVSEEAPERQALLLVEPSDEKFLYEIARDTWKYFENIVDRRTHLPLDHIRVAKPQLVGSYTTPTNLAMYLLACVSARELGIISKGEAVKRIRDTLQTLRAMKRWKGFYYNFYDTASLRVTRDYASSVDSGWLAAAWVVMRQAFPKELGEAATRFLKEIDFYEFYDEGIGQMRLGYDGAAGDFSPYHYGLIGTEARVTSYLAIGKGDLPREHWWMIYRTPPDRWSWQSQTPRGREVEIERVSFFQGYYTHQGKKFIPSWGGSLFEFLMPTLVIKEKELAPKGLGLNNRIVTGIHIDYALNRRGYPVWGISPAAVASGRQWSYREYGVKYLGVKGYRDEGVITPHVSFLSLDTLPDQAIDNLRRMLQLYDVYGQYGFYDSITVRSHQVNKQYLILDQGMTLVAIANYLKDGAIKEYFHRDEIGKKAETLLSQEEFFV